MTKLISANSSRIFGTNIFWIEMFLTLIISVGTVLTYSQESTYISSLIVMDMVVLSIIISVFMGILIGTEYSDGTIRNKIIVGHSRTTIYISIQPCSV